MTGWQRAHRRLRWRDLLLAMLSLAARARRGHTDIGIGVRPEEGSGNDRQVLLPVRGALNAAPRSPLVTVLAWLLMLGSGLLLPISFVSALMLMVGGDGTASATVGGVLLIVFAPAATLLAGFGLWRRWRWAWVYLMLLALAVLVLQIVGWWLGPTPQHSYVSASGVLNTVSAAQAQYSPLLILVCSGVLALLLLPRVRAEFSIAPSAASAASTAKGPVTQPPNVASAKDAIAAGRGWRVGHQGRDRMYYEEHRDGAWQRLDIEGEMLMGEAHHAVYLAAPDRWRHYPDWARDRREEIVGRIRSEFREPDYVYGGELGGAPPLARAQVRKPSRHGGQRWAIWLTIALLLAFTAGMVWLVWSGLGSGETWWPAKSSATRRIVTRLADPAMYWTALGLYAALGVGTLCLLVWGWRAARKDGAS